MKNLGKLSLMMLAVMALTISCEKEEKDDGVMNDTPTPKTGSFVAADQAISQNMITISEVMMSNDGWVVVHADNGNGEPMVPDLISEPVQVSSGANSDVKIQLNDNVTLSDGQTVWVMLHTDNGEIGTYEFDGSNGLDGPIKDNGQVVTSSITISSASITVSDQAVSNNSITIDNVYAATDGWLVVHNDDGSGGITLPGIIGKVQVSKGMNSNVTVSLDPNNTYTSGQKLFPMLHIDDNEIGMYEFDGSNGRDAPEIFGNENFPNNVIFTSLTVQ